MSDHPHFPVKLSEGRRLEVTVNELRMLLEQNAVEIIPNGGARAVFVALGQHYVGQTHGEEAEPARRPVADRPQA